MKEIRERVHRYFYPAAVVILAAATIAVVAYGLTHRFEPAAEKGPQVQPEDRYYLDARTVAEFGPVIIEKFNEQSELTVFSVDAAEPVNLKKVGIIDADILNKTQEIKYSGTARFYIDMDALGEQNISLAEDRDAVIIKIPHPRISDIEINPERFEAEDAKKGLFAFGELKFTPQEYNALEKEARRKLKEQLDSPENHAKADERALEEMKKIFQPVVKMVDSSYEVEIRFIR